MLFLANPFPIKIIISHDHVIEKNRQCVQNFILRENFISYITTLLKIQATILIFTVVIKYLAFQ